MHEACDSILVMYDCTRLQTAHSTTFDEYQPDGSDKNKTRGSSVSNNGKKIQLESASSQTPQRVKACAVTNHPVASMIVLSQRICRYACQHITLLEVRTQLFPPCVAWSSIAGKVKYTMICGQDQWSSIVEFDLLEVPCALPSQPRIHTCDMMYKRRAKNGWISELTRIYLSRCFLDKVPSPGEKTKSNPETIVCWMYVDGSRNIICLASDIKVFEEKWVYSGGD